MDSQVTITTNTNIPRVRNRVIVCMDGTWDTPSERTNVYYLYLHLNMPEGKLGKGDKKEDPEQDQWRQVAGYFEGVGTTQNKYLGGLFGLGLSNQIMKAYEFISRHYENEDDEIWIFGFSRGAYAARSLAGMIYNVGLLPDEHIETQAPEAYNCTAAEMKQSIQRKRSPSISALSINAWNPKLDSWAVLIQLVLLVFHNYPGTLVDQPVIWTLFHERNSFHDIRISPKVKSAFHALSIHEQRAWFTPALMDFGLKQREDQELEQIWFPGMHSDIGGQAEGSRLLPNQSLRWMMTKAADRGLKFTRTIDEICNEGGFYYQDSYESSLIYQIVSREDRVIDPSMFSPKGLAALYKDGQFEQFIEPEQLALYKSKTHHNYINSIKHLISGK
ncbi:hypothetical protein J3Q64DRAFT_1820876 [Phycomyces blakesleeanus]|uniref:T6SS Phospholipase effector Tle1-like catalytic domain-containing protein n=1 Tax=Phycomyces blakesleeanus TaxID=4837 RepID=A0ABR3B2S1_PHYBL